MYIISNLEKSIWEVGVPKILFDECSGKYYLEKNDNKFRTRSR